MGAYIHSSPQYRFNNYNNINDDNTLSEKVIGEILENNVTQIQVDTFYKLSNETYQKLNDRIFSIKPNICLRFYGWSELDLSILKHLSNVENLWLDIKELRNTKFIPELQKLKKLDLSSYDNIDNYEFLKYLPENLLSLSLQPHESKIFKLEIEHLSRFKQLKNLFILGHYKNLDKIIVRLQDLDTLILSKIKTIENIDFVKELVNLRKLHLKCIPIKSASVLNYLEKIKFLELYKIDCIENLDFLLNMSSLEHLFLQRMNQLEKFPIFKERSNLKKIELWYMKSIRDFTGLLSLNSLREFSCKEMTKNEPEDFLPILANKNVQNVEIWFLTETKRKIMAKYYEEYGHKMGDVKFLYEDTDY